MSLSGYITLAEAKEQVSIEEDNTAHDAILTRLLGAAEKHAVNWLNIDALSDLEESPVQSPPTIPDDVKSAILLLMGHLFENREAINVGNIVTKLPLGYEDLLWPYRTGLEV